MRLIALSWRRKEIPISLRPTVLPGWPGATSSMITFARLWTGCFKLRMSSGASGFALRCFGSGKCGEHLAEGRRWLESVLRVGRSGSAQERAKVLVYLSTFATVQRDFSAATDFVEQSLSIYQSLGDQWGVAVSMNARAIVAWDRQDHFAAQSYFEETLARWRALGYRVAVARCLHNLANFVRGRGDYAGARTALEEAGRILRGTWGS